MDTLPMLAPIDLPPPLEQAYENPSSTTLISFRRGHFLGHKINLYHPNTVHWYHSALITSYRRDQALQFSVYKVLFVLRKICDVQFVPCTEGEIRGSG
jgi:hypothetical protein